MMRRSAQLPRFCIKCGAPAENEPLRRKLRWIERSGAHVPFVGLLISLLVYLVSAERATIHVWLCEKHWEWRRTHMFGAAIVLLGGVAAIVAAAVLKNNPSRFPLASVGVLLIAISSLYAIFATRTVTALKIDGDFIWLAGANARFVMQFPPPPGR